MKFLLLFTVLTTLGLLNLGLNLTTISDDQNQEKTNAQLQKINSKIPKPSPNPLPQIPEQKRLDSGVHMFQTFNNCGPAAMSMNLSHLGINISQNQIGQTLRPWQNSAGNNDDKSVTLAELALLAQEYGLVAYHRPAGDIDLLQQFIANDLPVIVRTWLNTSEDIGHYRVVLGYDDSTQVIIQDDSLQGQGLSYSYADFNQLWQAFNYEFLVIAPKAKQEQIEIILAELKQSNQAWQIAWEKAESRLGQEPADLYARFNQLVALTKLGRYVQAVDVYNQIKSDLPSRMLWYQIEPLLALYQAGDHDQVLEISDRILNNGNLAYSELHQLRSEIFLARNQNELAQEAKSLAQTYGSSNQYWLINLKL